MGALCTRDVTLEDVERFRKNKSKSKLPRVVSEGSKIRDHTAAHASYLHEIAEGERDRQALVADHARGKSVRSTAQEVLFVPNVGLRSYKELSHEYKTTDRQALRRLASEANLKPVKMQMGEASGGRGKGGSYDPQPARKGAPPRLGPGGQVLRKSHSTVR